MSYSKILTSLAEQKELVIPWFETAVLSEKWPESYNITIDSGEYYGRGDGYFHPSTHPLKGARELYYEFHPDTRDKYIRERRSLQSLMTMSMGTAIHGIVQTQFQIAGMLRPENTEWEYVDDDHHVRGRIDFIVDHPDGNTYPVELKAQNSYHFQKQDKIKAAWDAQLSLALDNSGHDFGVLLVIEAGWPYHMKEFHVPRNDGLLSEIYAKFDHVRQCIETNTPPRYCCTLGSQQMERCPARFQCWLKEDK